MATKNTGASASINEKLVLVKEAQAEQQTVITEARVEFLEKLMDMKSIGGQDNVQESLLETVSKFPDGIPFPFLQMAFPEALLVKAREALKKAGKIEQIGKKGNVVLKLKASD